MLQHPVCNYFTSSHSQVNTSSSTSPPTPPFPPPLPPSPQHTHLKHQRGPLRLLVPPQLKVLAPLQRQLRLGLAVRAFEPQHHLLRRLRLLVEHGLRLAPVAGLLAVVAALALGDRGGLHGTHGGASQSGGV